MWALCGLCVGSVWALCGLCGRSVEASAMATPTSAPTSSPCGSHCSAQTTRVRHRTLTCTTPSPRMRNGLAKQLRSGNASQCQKVLASGVATSMNLHFASQATDATDNPPRPPHSMLNTYSAMSNIGKLHLQFAKAFQKRTIQH